MTHRLVSPLLNESIARFRQLGRAAQLSITAKMRAESVSESSVWARQSLPRCVVAVGGSEKPINVPSGART
jgi:hypothetical protein